MDELYNVNVKKLINTYLGLIFKAGLGIVLFATLFLFTALFTEIYDTPKFLVLLTFTALLLVLLALRFTILGKVILVRTSLDIPFLLLLSVGIVSTVLSAAPYVSLLGNQLRINGSLIGIISLVLFYFILVNNLKGVRDIRQIFSWTVIATQLLAVISLLAFIGVKLLPPPWVQGLNFTTTGSSFSTTAILALLIPFIVMQILNSTKPLFIILNSLFLLLSGLTIALTGSWATWVGAILALVLTLAASSPVRQIRQIKPVSLIGLIAPVCLIGLITILSFIPPIGDAQNPLYTQARNFPREIQLPFIPSWKISVSAFRDSPFWGSGPSTYLFDFTTYKPVEFNSSKFWNIRFDSAFNEYFQTLSTLGGIGLLALVSLTALFISAAYRTYRNYLINRPEARLGSEKLILAISGAVFFVILALHSASLSLWIMGILILASYMVVNLAEGFQKSWGTNQGDLKSMFIRIAANITSQNPSEETIKVDALPGVLLAVVLALTGAAFFLGGKFVVADYHHRLALNAVAQNQGLIVYNELVAAEKLNPFNDLYRTDLAQTNFALANAIAVAKAPSEASPAGSLTDEDKQNIQVLLQQSIAEGRAATTLNPRSPVNWEILALLYRQIAGVAQNALIFSLDAYGRAIFQDPLNPQLRLNVGGVYYAIQNYDLAIRFFTDAINLKSDFANGYYNLSVALRDKGDLANAQAVAEKLITLIKEDSLDYQPANDYLTDLKNRIASGSAKESNIKPPASQTTGALQKKELPKVVNVGNPPEKIATPEAVKKPEPTPTPNP